MASSVVCLLCRHERTQIIDALTPAEIGRLWNYFGVTLGAEAQASFQGAARITQHRCASCGFEFFDPVLPGNGAAELFTWAARDAAGTGRSLLPAPGFADYGRASPAGEAAANASPCPCAAVAGGLCLCTGTRSSLQRRFTVALGGYPLAL